MSMPVLLIVAVLGVIGFAVLLVIGLLMLREEKRAKAKTTDTSAGPVKASRPALKTARGAPDGAHEVLRLLRDDLSGQLVVELAGQRYANPAEIQEPKVLAALLAARRDLEAFAGAAPPESPAAPGPVEPTSVPPPVNAPLGTAPLGTVRTANPPPLPPPSMNPFKQVQILREIAKNAPPAPKSITEQVDEILQAKLAGTPLAERGVFVRTGPKGNALFVADGQEYLAVDEVPDAEVRDLIRAAVAEWEAKG